AYLGGTAEDNSNVSPQTREVIDEEVQRIIGTQYQRAQGLLTEHRAALETLAKRLLKDETVDGSAVKAALAQGKEGPCTAECAESAEKDKRDLGSCPNRMRRPDFRRAAAFYSGYLADQARSSWLTPCPSAHHQRQKESVLSNGDGDSRDVRNR